MVTIKKWSIKSHSNNPYLAPELMRLTLFGKIYGHPDHDDDQSAKTSIPVSVDKKQKIITTKSGTEYKLTGPPCKDWKAYLDDNEYTVEQYFDALVKQAKVLEE